MSSHKSKSHHLIFDLDGTLIDSKVEIVKTYQQVFSDIIPTQSVDIAKINYGATLQAVLESVYGNNQIDKITQAKSLFASYYDNSLFEQTLLYDSVYQTLSWLTTEGHHLYIATNKRQTPTLRILQCKKIAHFFSDLVTSDMSDEKILSKEQMIARLKQQQGFVTGFMVGDSAYDIIAGNMHNLTTIAVSYGYEEKAALAQHNPTYLIDSFAQLLNFL